MKRAYILPALVALSAAFSSPTFAQDAAPEPQAATASSGTLTTKLHSVLLPEPATEEGFASVRIADAAGEAVYRGMIPLVAGARTLDLSTVSVPAAGNYTMRVVYPGGMMMEELKTPYNLPVSASAEKDAVAGR